MRISSLLLAPNVELMPETRDPCEHASRLGVAGQSLARLACEEWFYLGNPIVLDFAILMASWYSFAPSVSYQAVLQTPYLSNGAFEEPPPPPVCFLGFGA